MMENREVKYVFENIKNGDGFGFYHNLWYYLFTKLIKLFTRKKVEHVGAVMNVQRENSTVVSFNFYEQKGGDGGIYYDKGFIYYDKVKNIYSTTFSKKINILYYRENDLVLTAEQEKLAYEDIQYMLSKGEEYKKRKRGTYNYLMLPLTLNWVYYLLTEVFKIKSLKDYRNNIHICSMLCKVFYYKIGYITKKEFESDIYPTPMEFLTLPRGKVYQIDYNKP